MKLVSLNTWGARAGHGIFLDFFKQYRDDIDIFCLQEVWHVSEENSAEVTPLLKDAIAGGVVLKNMMTDLFPRVGDILKDHVGFFRPHYGTHYGLAMFVRKDFNIIEEGEIWVYKDKNYTFTGDVGKHARNIQYVTIQTSKGIRTIVNFHGLWNGKGKTDSDDRLIQSENIAKFVKEISNPFVLCGDFNLLPNTESLKKIENSSLRNLIKEFGISSTRTSFYKKEGKFADYTFVSKDIKVNEFKILSEEVSDHAAMYLDFE